MRQQNKTGFTLIEIVIVATIIGMLSTIAVVSILNASNKASQAAKNRNVTDVEKAKGQLTLPSGTVRGAMNATMDTSLSAGTSGQSNLLSALNISNIDSLTVGNDQIDIGTMNTKASYLNNE